MSHDPSGGVNPAEFVIDLVSIDYENLPQVVQDPGNRHVCSTLPLPSSRLPRRTKKNRGRSPCEKKQSLTSPSERGQAANRGLCSCLALPGRDMEWSYAAWNPVVCPCSGKRCQDDTLDMEIPRSNPAERVHTQEHVATSRVSLARAERALSHLKNLCSC